MTPEQLENLQQQYTGRHVRVALQRPELARMAGKLGTIRSVNRSGRALVQFEGADEAWYDIDPDFLSVVEKEKSL